MKGIIYLIPSDDAEKVKGKFRELDEKLQETLNGKCLSDVSAVIEMQDAIKKYLADKKEAGIVEDAENTLNMISVKYGLVLNADEIAEVIEETDLNPDMKRLLEDAKSKEFAVAIEPY